MSDQVGNPEDWFSQNEAHIFSIITSTIFINFLGIFCLFAFLLYVHGKQLSSHYANTPMQYTAIFHGCKNVHFQMKVFNIFLIFAQNIELWVPTIYVLEQK